MRKQKCMGILDNKTGREEGIRGRKRRKEGRKGGREERRRINY